MEATSSRMAVACLAPRLRLNIGPRLSTAILNKSGQGPHHPIPVGGYHGLRKGYRGRFVNYVMPVMERLGLIELEHNQRDNRARAI